MKPDLNKTGRTNLEILLTGLVILLYLSRTAIPFFKFLFIPIYAGLVLYIIFAFYPRLYEIAKEFVHSYLIILLLCVILTASFILSGKLYLSIFKDVCNSIIIISFYFLLTALITQKDYLNFFFKTFLILLILFAFVISANGLATLFNIFSIGVRFNPADVSGDSYAESVAVDSNFSQLIVFFGMITLLYWMNKTQPFWKILIIDFLLVLFSISIFFSGSRRGLIVISLIIGFIVLIQFIALIKGSSPLKRIASGSVYYLIIMALVGSLVFIFINYTPYKFKNKALELLGVENTYMARRGINFVILKYVSVLNNTITYSDIDKSIWTPNLSPLDPDSGWGTRIHTTVYPLTGIDSEIVPADSKGYLMDKSCNSDSRSGNAYSYTAIFSKNVEKDITLAASVYCYLSSDFDGTWAMLTTEGTNVGIKESEYNLGKKGTWQKLNLNVKSTGGISNIYLYFSKFGVNDFSLLRGYVIYAYPEVRELYPEAISMNLTDSVIVSGTALSKLKILEKQGDVKNTFPTSIRSKLRLNKIIIKADSFVSSKLPSPDISLRKDPEKYVNASLFPFTISSQSIHLKKDSLIKLISHLFSEDTTYLPLKNNILIDTNIVNLSGTRLVRWKFAWQIYTKEFNLRQKIMGGGFNFLNWYGYYFLRDKTKSDWPHNPFISILLYSGLIGLVLYLFLLYKVVYYYLLYLKEFYILFIFFLITFFFSFFSGGSPFDPPLIGFFTFLPFFIHSIHKKLLASS